jgi:riboflavin synthase
MFTGLIQELGTVAALLPQQGGDVRMQIAAPADFMADVRLGDSIAVSGVCLTALDLHGTHFSADVSLETLRLTTLGRLQAGTKTNLEKSLQVGQRLGGHFVSGHVDGIGQVLAISAEARSQRWDFSAPYALAKFVAEKGSIAIEGVSLTVNAVWVIDAARFGFSVNLIPHTLEHTNLGTLAQGNQVNLEIDLIARYLARQQDVLQAVANHD